MPDEKVKAEICDLLAEGNYLTAICEREGFPSYKTLRKWIAEDAEFSKCIAHAQEEQADFFRDKIMRLNDGMDAATWQYKNAQVRNIQWLMGKIKPKAYGDKVENYISGPAGGPIQAAITVQFVKTGEEPK